MAVAELHDPPPRLDVVVAVHPGAAGRDATDVAHADHL
jgi:hypothetical protein